MVFQEKNTAYMVMEFLRGQSLMQLVETRGKIPENEAIELIEKAGHALEEVHRAGLLNRGATSRRDVLLPKRARLFRSIR